MCSLMKNCFQIDKACASRLGYESVAGTLFFLLSDLRLGTFDQDRDCVS